MWAHKIPGKPWRTGGADIFTLNNINYFCIADCHSKFPVLKRTEGLLSDHSINSCKVVFEVYGLPKKVMYDACTNLISENIQKI